MNPDPTARPGDPTPNPDPGASGPSAEPTVAFCQQCGRPLTAATRRAVGNGTFCEPCALAAASPGASSAPSPGWTPVPGAVPYPGTPAAPARGEPNPLLAGFLGLIPGVGAMYNGQYAKGVVHLIIFVVLQSLAEDVSDAFGWLVAGWIFYQAFEAYHTAIARRDGLPLPDPFGWNDLGERLGFHRTSPPVARPAAPPETAGAPSPAGTSQPFTPPPPAPAYTYTTSVPDSGYAAAYTSVSHLSPIPPVTPMPPVSSATSTAHPSTQIPYAETFTGPAAAVPQTVPPTPRRFPVGALWLIGLGVVFLIGNIIPDWRLSGRWVIPFLLAAAALWAGTTRVVSWRERALLSGIPGPLDTLASALLFPGVLLTFAVLLGLQVAGGPRLAHTWPALLIVWGALLLLGRVPRPEASAKTPDTTEDRRNSPTSILS